MICDNHSKIINTSKSYESSIHDKKIFETEYKELKDNIRKNIPILGDKAYVGLEQSNVKCSSKRNEIRYKKDKIKGKLENKNLNTNRVKIEHIFANIKNYRILRYGNYYGLKKIESIFEAIVNIYNLNKTN